MRTDPLCYDARMSRMRIAIFLTVAVLILGITNAVVYQALATTFGITAAAPMIALGATIAFLSLSFIAATIIGNYYYNVFTRAYYTMSAVWSGVLVYLFLASTVYGLLTAVFPTLVASGQWIIGGVILVSVYGVVHARSIAIKRISVTLPNTPEAWKNKRIVWISDVHLGQLHGIALAKRVVAAINALSPDIIFVGGDLYDGSGARDIPELTLPLRDLRAPQGVYFVTGNHEEYGHKDEFVTAVQTAGMRVLDNEMLVLDGLQLVGVDYQDAADTGRFTDILSRLAIDPRKPSILLKHEPRDLEVAEAAGISLQISGHTHKAQMWPLVYIAQRTYKGFAYGLKRLGRMQVYTSSGVGSWGPPMRVGTNSEIVMITLQ